MKNIIKTFDDLVNIDPPALLNDDDYIERPVNGWIKCDSGFIGIGYYGNTLGVFADNWYPAKAGLGHIPPNGYG